MRAVLIVLLLSGCATTAADLSRKSVSASFESAKSPAQWVACVTDRYRGVAQVRNDGEDHYWLVLGPQSDPWSRWDFVRTGATTRAELRSNININNGDGAVEACAQG